jgi:hypothetical protein
MKGEKYTFVVEGPGETPEERAAYEACQRFIQEHPKATPKEVAEYYEATLKEIKGE